jgi:hypothetical protein
MKDSIFRIIILSLLLALAASLFGQAVPAAVLDKKLKKQTVDSLSRMLDSIYVFPKTAAKMSAQVKKNLKAGKYDKIDNPEDLAAKLTEDLQAISHDLHLRVRYEPEQIASMRKDTAKSEVPPEMLKSWKKINYGFVKTEYLPGNVGYLDLRVFTDPKIPEAGLAAVSAMNSLANCEAIIFDLRKNGGGYAEMIQLLTSYLFADVTHLNDFFERQGNMTQQSWTLPYIPGPRRPKVPVYVLTSNYTFSGAEEFSNNLKELKRATIVGEVTGGGAHPVNFKILNDLFSLSLPFGRAVNPISKSNWEGTGVAPHIKVPADSAFNRAYLMALDTLIKSSVDGPEKKSLESIRQLKQAEFNNYQVPEKILKSYAGVYGTRTVAYQNGQLYLSRAGRPGFKLVPFSNTGFVVDVAGGQVVFNIDQAGKVTGMEFTRSDGEVIKSEKDQ